MTGDRRIEALRTAPSALRPLQATLLEIVHHVGSFCINNFAGLRSTWACHWFLRPHVENFLPQLHHGTTKIRNLAAGLKMGTMTVFPDPWSSPLPAEKVSVWLAPTPVHHAESASLARIHQDHTLSLEPNRIYTTRARLPSRLQQKVLSPSSEALRFTAACQHVSGSSNSCGLFRPVYMAKASNLDI